MVRIVVENALELTSHKFCFSLRIPRLQILQIRSRAFLRAQRLAQPLRIVRDHRAGGVENILRRTVVALQFDDSSSGKIPGETQENGNVRTSPAIDRLIFVAHNTNVLLRPGQQPQQLILHAISVLIFVHVNVLEACLPLLPRRRGFAQQTRRSQEQVVEVQGFAVVKELFVSHENIGDAPPVLVERFGAQLLGCLAMIFRMADPAENIPRRQTFVFDLQLGHGQLDCRKLVFIVVYRKTPRQIGGSRFAPEQPRAERMKRGKPGPPRRDPGAQQEVRDTIAHLFRGFVGERDRKNGFGGDSAGNQIGHAIRDRTGLAGAGTGEDQHRAFHGFDGQPLLGVQIIEKSEHLSSVVGESLHTSC